MNSAQHIVERWTGWTLRLGVWVSGALMVVGLLMTVVQSQHVPAANPTVTEVLSNLFSHPLDALTVTATGLLLLMFTPFLRVLTALIGFVAEKDWQFMLISLAVFLMLVGELVYSLR